MQPWPWPSDGSACDTQSHDVVVVKAADVAGLIAQLASDVEVTMTIASQSLRMTEPRRAYRDNTFSCASHALANTVYLSRYHAPAY